MAGSFWKPKASQYKVTALSEIIESEPFKRTHDDGTVETTEQFKLMIQVGDEKFNWTFGKGNTLASTFGQLVQLATKGDGTLTGKTFTVVVKSDGKKNDYTIIE